MSSSYGEKLELQKALCSLLKQIVAKSATEDARQNAIEAVVLMLDQLPLKKRLAEHHRKYYDLAILVTQKDVSRNIVDFPIKYNLNILDISDRDSIQLAKVEESFIRWVLMILKTDCIDEYRKTPEYRESHRKKQDAKSGEKPSKIRKRSTLSDAIKEVKFDGSPGDTQDYAGGNEYKLGADIEGKSIGEVNSYTHSLDGIEWMLEKEKSKEKSIEQQLKEYIGQDPKNKLKELHPRNQADCNCHVLLQLFLLKNLTMDEVYEKLKCKGCKKGTIRNYLTEYKEDSSRKEKSCLNLIQKIAKDKFNL